ncbi:hypothetical protein I203_101379 [Kwoniella mangroviensis CBS 8507]|uniref:uncharacterized protein n=1 Tax=Kwoniella mangroviensis CBS 8507 TaxID=1296122 RepID=UPI00080D73D5|nr:uncharacterized protein I203_03016 [Kwoniella mangroviensis CBS 8507]OCF68348.1 hypothetical protein I203_03016 [Kwoniella mangroviensis CBS 8507]
MFWKEPIPLEAWVESNVGGKRLNEYQVLHHEKDQKGYPYTECFLETIDETFSIKIKMNDVDIFERHGWYSRCRIDGLSSPGSRWKYRAINTFDTLKERKDGKVYESKLKFASLATIDEEEQVTIGGDILSKLGTIRIDIQFGEWIADSSTHKGYLTIPISGVVHEKVKKIPFVIQGSDPVITPDQEYIKYDFHPSKEGMKYYRFIFNYRPRPVLELMGVIENVSAAPSTDIGKRRDHEADPGSNETSRKDKKIKVKSKKKGRKSKGL